ncbi:DeoR family transcriptional regulator, partial [Streptomyces sp. A1547]
RRESPLPVQRRGGPSAQLRSAPASLLEQAAAGDRPRVADMRRR